MIQNARMMACRLLCSSFDIVCFKTELLRLNEIPMNLREALILQDAKMMALIWSRSLVLDVSLQIQGQTLPFLQQTIGSTDSGSRQMFDDNLYHIPDYCVAIDMKFIFCQIFVPMKKVLNLFKPITACPRSGNQEKVSTLVLLVAPSGNQNCQVNE